MRVNYSEILPPFSALLYGGRSTVPKYNSAEKGKFQNNLHAFSREREITDGVFIFGTVEQIFHFRHCCTSALLYCPD